MREEERKRPSQPAFLPPPPSCVLSTPSIISRSGLLGRDRRRVRLGRLVALKRQQLLAENRNIPRGLNPQADFAAVNVHHRDADVFADVDLFTQFATQDQHSATLR